MRGKKAVGKRKGFARVLLQKRRIKKKRGKLAERSEQRKAEAMKRENRKAELEAKLRTAGEYEKIFILFEIQEARFRELTADEKSLLEKYAKHRKFMEEVHPIDVLLEGLRGKKSEDAIKRTAELRQKRDQLRKKYHPNSWP